MDCRDTVQKFSCILFSTFFKSSLILKTKPIDNQSKEIGKPDPSIS